MVEERKKFMSFIKSLFSSFGHAICGFGAALKRERNLRIHIVAILYMTFFGILYGLGKTEWAVLIITMAGVVSAELMNTAIEENTDLKSSKINLHAKIAKDTAAAAVLVEALAAVLIAVFLFSDLGKVLAVLKLATSLPYVILLAISLIAAIFFIAGFKKHQKGTVK